MMMSPTHKQKSLKVKRLLYSLMVTKTPTWNSGKCRSEAAQLILLQLRRHVLIINSTTISNYSSSVENRWCSVSKQLCNIWFLLIAITYPKHCPSKFHFAKWLCPIVMEVQHISRTWALNAEEESDFFKSNKLTDTVAKYSPYTN